MSILSIVATPIGNLEDITLRALRVLRACDAVLCEDTRVTKKLLIHFEITKPLISYHAHSGAFKYEKVFALLSEGKHLVLVSDAGTPAVSDPGAHLIHAVRERFGDDVRVEVVPGPSALAAAWSIAGVPTDTFTFLGFPPHKKGRSTFFGDVVRRHEAVVFYESPHRFLKALEALAAHGLGERRVVVCRELTKVHEEVIYGTLEEIRSYYTDEHPEKVRGEFVVVIAPYHPIRT